jgi:DNA-binding transcriptional LysR family regulator
VLVASRRYLERRGAPARPEELQAHRCLHYPRSNETATWSFEPPGRRRLPAQRVTVPIQGPLAATNSEALRDAALADLGIALLPDFSAQAALRSGELVQVLARWQHVGTFARSVHALRPYSPHVPLAVVALVQHLRHSLAGGFPLKPLL